MREGELREQMLEAVITEEVRRVEMSLLHYPMLVQGSPSHQANKTAPCDVCAPHAHSGEQEQSTTDGRGRL